MRTSTATTITVALLAGSLWAMGTAPSESGLRSLDGQDGSLARPISAGSPTPAQAAIQRAEEALAETGAGAEAYLALATASSRRARETADPAWYDRSDEALALAEKLSPGSFQLERQRVWNQLGRHEFAAALDAAKTLHERAKDDVPTYGLIVDACVELGRYDEAEEAAQWMLDLRPGAPVAMTRVSYLREHFGDLRGARDAMERAFYSTRPGDREARAWMLTQLAHLDNEEGLGSRAHANASAALELFPDYHYALKELATASASLGDDAEALRLLRRRYELAPHPENLFDVAMALRALGAAGKAEASALLDSFEEAALEESTSVDNANLELIEYWTEVSPEAGGIARARALAEKRLTCRRDIRTLEALAWTRFLSGDAEEAWAAIDEAVQVGSKNSRLRYRAGRIAAALGRAEDAEEHLIVACTTAPRSSWARLARAALEELD